MTISRFLFSACTTETEKVCRVSSEDHLQPFKDKMEEFLSQGKAQERRCVAVTLL